MLREVWLNIGVEKVDMHEDTTVKALLDNSVTKMFMNKKMTAKYGFKLQKLNKLVMVRNVDRTNNSRETITHQVKVNVYYKSYIERIRIDMCNLQRTDIILDMLWLQVYNPEINWEMKEVKITRYPPIYRRKKVVKKDIEKKKRREENKKNREKKKKRKKEVEKREN